MPIRDLPKEMLIYAKDPETGTYIRCEFKPVNISLTNNFQPLGVADSYEIHIDGVLTKEITAFFGESNQESVKPEPFDEEKLWKELILNGISE